MKRKQLFNDGWEFTKQADISELSELYSREISWSQVDLPHDWLIYDTKNLYENGVGWYRKRFTISELEKKVITVCFEGVYMNSTVYVNNTYLGEWKYGYSSFEFEITPLLQLGDNEIVVRVIHEAPNSRWYSGAGIYRNVWLKTMNEAHLVTDGVYLATRKNAEDWELLLSTEGINQSKSTAELEAQVRHTIYDESGNIVAVAANPILLCNSIKVDKQSITLADPNLWQLDRPYLYALKTELIIAGVTVDEELQRFGFRTIRIDPNKGFFLNDCHIKLHGACMHHDLGALGAAVNKAALKRQLMLLTEMGVNAIRTAHNMPAVELMELADEMGILIVSEAFDIWERSKTQYDYSRFFPEWHERDVASWIRRDRNHPSIIMWSIGNEIYDTHADERGFEVTKQLKALVQKHDPLGNGFITLGSNYMAWEGAQHCAQELSAVGYNYGEWLYEEHHQKYPNWVIYGSETASTLQSRGIYHFPLSKVVVTHEDEQCSSLDNCTTNWGAKNAQKNIIDDRDAKYCLGQFIWTGFDYIGEPTPYTTKNSYFGHIDTAGFPKDSFYLYQAEWTDYKKKPMVHLLPYWDFNEGQLIDIKIYSNAPKTELFFNDESMGVYRIDHLAGSKLSGEWRLPYRPGVLKAVAYDEEDHVIAVDVKSSFGDAAKLVLKPDKASLRADGLDLLFVEISAVDAKGIPVENANNRVEVAVSGAGRLVGLDNGDSTDYDQYKGSSRKLFSGKLLAIIAAKQEPGEVRIKVSSRSLPTEELVITAVPSEPISGISALLENEQSEPNDEIPIRKIALTVHGSNHLNKSNQSVMVTAKLYPENTTYQDIVWKVLTPGGIATNIAEVKAEGLQAMVTALGDGEFRLRCAANNGKRNYEIISEMEFTVTGMGTATINPYEFVYAGLCTDTNYELNGGLLNGVSTREFTETWIGFRGLDFGELGSDEITIPIYFLENGPLPIELWEGMPNEPNARRLLKANYQAECQYGHYIPKTFKLPRRLKGVTTLCIVLWRSLNLQGFVFTKLNKAYERLSAAENNNLYGDSFTLAEDSIEQIGNNVTIEFEDMDFAKEGFRKLIICGRSHIEKNTIHIRFQGEEGQINQIAEFPYSQEYCEREFELTSVTGKQRVSFIFLPGSSFDFKWFQFVK
jgi:beta-galactosidase